MTNVFTECDENLDIIRGLAREIVRDITDQALKRFESEIICVYCRICHGNNACNRCQQQAVTKDTLVQCEPNCNKRLPDAVLGDRRLLLTDTPTIQLLGNRSESNSAKQDNLHHTLSTCENTSYSKNKNTALKHDAFSLCDTFLYTLFHSGFSYGKSSVRPKQPNKKVARRMKKEKLLKKRMKDFPALDKPLPTYEEMGFWTESDLATPVDGSLVCAVCMELYYKPHSCLPCEHVFCEPCLRRMAKYNSDNRMIDVCPICRQEIQHCVPSDVTLVAVRTSHHYAYNKRHKSERGGRFMSYPLPAKTTPVRKQAIVQAVTNRQRLASYRQYIHVSVVKKIVTIFMLIVLALLMLFIVSKVLLAYENDNKMTRWYVEFCDNLYNYNYLEIDKQISVTNQSILVLSLITIISTVVYLII